MEDVKEVKAKLHKGRSRQKQRDFSQPYNYRVVFALDFLNKRQRLHGALAGGLSWVLDSVMGDCLLERFMLSCSTTVNVCGLSLVNKRFKDRIPAGVCAKERESTRDNKIWPSEMRAKCLHSRAGPCKKNNSSSCGRPQAPMMTGKQD